MRCLGPDHGRLDLPLALLHRPLEHDGLTFVSFTFVSEYS